MNVIAVFFLIVLAIIVFVFFADRYDPLIIFLPLSLFALEILPYIWPNRIVISGIAAIRVGLIVGVILNDVWIGISASIITILLFLLFFALISLSE